MTDEDAAAKALPCSFLSSGIILACVRDSWHRFLGRSCLQCFTPQDITNGLWFPIEAIMKIVLLVQTTSDYAVSSPNPSSSHPQNHPRPDLCFTVSNRFRLLIQLKNFTIDNTSFQFFHRTLLIVYCSNFYAFVVKFAMVYHKVLVAVK